MVDLTDFNDVVGIEILDFTRQLSTVLLPDRTPVALRWAYDDEVDAFYVHVHEQRAQQQVNANGIAYLGQLDRLLVLEVSWSSGQY
ncbi:hypothetical protein [Rathayibacter soli]|uniref:hypothetical protein n=1 Tax=Rathayibacter soli TaxID=3144168 RepID=UPI0027E52719|nr:hypothetical protein [Glaciibacter superstes]